MIEKILLFALLAAMGVIVFALREVRRLSREVLAVKHELLEVQAYSDGVVTATDNERGLDAPEKP